MEGGGFQMEWIDDLKTSVGIEEEKEFLELDFDTIYSVTFWGGTINAVDSSFVSLEMDPYEYQKRLTKVASDLAKEEGVPVVTAMQKVFGAGIVAIEEDPKN